MPENKTLTIDEKLLNAKVIAESLEGFAELRDVVDILEISAKLLLPGNYIKLSFDPM